jgi:hypothetical protein
MKLLCEKQLNLDQQGKKTMKEAQKGYPNYSRLE